MKTQVSILLEEKPESYYWIGFLMADGSINHAVNRIKLEISRKDKNHLNKYKIFVGGTLNESKTTNSFSVSIADKDIIPKIVDKFNFNPKKTYNPPKLNIKDINLFLAFMI